MAANRARDLRKNATEAELRLWARLRRRQIEGHQFRRQAPIGRYIVDFVCFARKLIVEVDGGQHSLDRDAERTRWLEGEGFRVLRFWNNEVLCSTDAVVEAIRDDLRERRTGSSPPPNPPQ
jgi:very-short-patch-repair endonuclease